MLNVLQLSCFFPAISCHCDRTIDGRHCFCQIWTRESIKRHRSGSVGTVTSHATGLSGPTKVWNCSSMLISLQHSWGYNLLRPLLIKNCLSLQLPGRLFPHVSPFCWLLREEIKRGSKFSDPCKETLPTSDV